MTWPVVPHLYSHRGDNKDQWVIVEKTKDKRVLKQYTRQPDLQNQGIPPYEGGPLCY